MSSRRPGERFNRGRIQTAVAAVPSINVGQSFSVETSPMTAGVIDIVQGFTVDASGQTGTDIKDLPNVVAVYDVTSTYVTSSASLTAGSDLSDAAWSKTGGVTITADVTGTQDRINCNGTAAPTVSQAITNAQFGASMVPLVISWWFSYESVQWAVIEGRASTAVNRVWCDVQNGAFGTVDSGMTATSVAAETRNGVGGYRFTVTMTGVAAALTARVQLSTTNSAFTTPGAGTSMLADDCTVSQVRVESVADRKTGALLEQLTVNLQPGYETGPLGHPCRRYYGAQYLIDTEATHYGAVDGADAEYTLHYVAEVVTPDAVGTIVGAGNSGVANNQARLWGTSATGAGRYRSQIHDDAAASSLVDSSSDIAADAHVGEWTTGAAGTEIYMSKDGASVTLTTNTQNVGACTLDRMAEGSRPDSTPDSFFIGRVYGWVLTTGAPVPSQNTTVRAALYSQFGLFGS